MVGVEVEVEVGVEVGVVVGVEVGVVVEVVVEVEVEVGAPNQLVIHTDKALLATLHETIRWCEWCGKDARQAGSLELHHIRARGMGGGSRLDIRINLVMLCGPWGGNCHRLAQEGEIPSLSLYRMAGAREGYTAEEAEAAVLEILRWQKHRPLPERLRRLLG